MSVEHSRALRLAASVTGASESELARRMAQNAVVVSIDPDLPGSTQVALTMIDTLSRGPSHIHLDPQGVEASTVEAILAAASAVAPHRPVTTAAPPADAIAVRVGCQGPAATITVLGDRHGVRVAVDGRPLCQGSPPSALGVMTASAFAAGEVFKRVVRPRADRVAYPDAITFCPVTLSDDLGAAPMLPPNWSPSLGLVGNGAVGTGHARVLAGLPVDAARAIAIDPEDYGPENTGTYSLGVWQDVVDKTPKVMIVKRTLAGWAVTAISSTAEDAISTIEAEGLAWPPVVLAGLDSIEARRSVQGMWPVALIDAATGDTSVGLHHVAADGPCLRCFFAERHGEHSSAVELAAEFGLPIDLVMRGDHMLSDADLAGLSRPQRERLRPQVGKPVCGLADAARLTGTDDVFRPSVPFVSQQAACLGIGRLIASAAGVDGLANFVQYDALIGPQRMTHQTRRPRPDCYCQHRQETIRAVRAARQLA